MLLDFVSDLFLLFLPTISEFLLIDSKWKDAARPSSSLLEDRNKSRPEGVCVGGGLFLSCSLIFPKIDGLVSIVLSDLSLSFLFSVELAVRSSS